MLVTIYEITVFLHVLGMGGLFAAFALEWVVERLLGRASSAEDVRGALGLMPVAMRLGSPSAIVILLTGGHMTHAAWGWDKPWIAMSAAAMLVALGLGGAGSARNLKAIGRAAAAATGSLSPALRALLAAPAIPALLRIRIGLLVSIVALMTVRPGWAGALVTPLVCAGLGFAAAKARKRVAAA